MNAILFYVVPQFRLTGSTINAVEYFLEGFEHNPELKLYLLDGTKAFRRKIMSVIFEKYDMGSFTHAMHNIECLKKSELPGKAFETVLILDYVTVGQVKGIIRAKKILVISEKYLDNPEYFLSKDLYNVEYYGEMPFHYKDHDYRMKCLFERYKPLKEVLNGTYVNSPRNNDLIYDIPEISRVFIYLPTPFIFKSKTDPEENLFEKFTHYLYYHADKWFDPHPRLFLECRYYKKLITYHNPSNIKDGSWYRYQDLLERGLYNRTLNRADEVIQQLI